MKSAKALLVMDSLLQLQSRLATIVATLPEHSNRVATMIASLPEL
jgi:hypothetical protein